MALINEITGKLLTQLSGSSSSVGSSTINGQGVSSSFGGASSLSEGLSALSTAFQESSLRLSQPFTVFSYARNALTELLELTDDLIKLARRASSEQTAADERGTINGLFQRKVQQFRKILDAAKANGIDFRDKNDLSDVLSGAGINLSSATALADFFNQIAPIDNELGYSRILGDDAIVEDVAHTTTGKGTYRSPLSFASGLEPSAIRVYDFDGDGNLDLFLGDDNLGTFSTYLGNGRGSFAAPQSFSTGGALVDVVIGEFSGDSNADIIAAIDPARLAAGTFSDSLTLTAAIDYVDVGDLNNDELVDIVGVAGSSAQVLLSNGDGTFLAPLSYDLFGLGIDDIALADSDGDGDLDLFLSGNVFGFLIANGDGTFTSPVSLTGTVAASLNLKDVNKDGFIDIVGTGGTSNGRTIAFLGNGDNTFQAPISATIVDKSYGGAVADIDGDGILDLVSSSDDSGVIEVSLGLGTGGFVPLHTLTAPAVGRSVYLRDMNDDGRIDIVTNRLDVDKIDVYIGNGDGTFSASISYGASTASGTEDIAIYDFDSDGILDIAGTYIDSVGGTDALFIMKGNGDGSFLAPVSKAITSAPVSMAVADFDSDGVVDLVTAHGSSIGVHFGDGQGTASPGVSGESVTGSFGAPTSFNQFSGVNATIADVDRDGNGDVITTSGGNIYVALGNGDGSLRVPTSYFTGGNFSVHLEDLNRDGILDATQILSTATHSLAVALGNSDGSFSAAVTYGVGLGTITAQSARHLDLNRDGNVDIAIGTVTYGVQVQLGNGDGTFSIGSSFFTVGGDIEKISDGDFNKDGFADLALSDPNQQVVKILYGAGDGTFSSSLSVLSASVGGTGLDVKDINHDGNDDIVQISTTGTTVHLGNGDGTFAAGVSYATSNTVSYHADDFLIDLNRDGNLDIAGAAAYALGNGDGTFQAFSSAADWRAGFGDLNNDGLTDVVGNFSGLKTLVYLGNRGDTPDAGTFSANTSFSAVTSGSAPGDFFAHDVNRDGSLDLVVAEQGGSGVLNVLIGNSDGTYLAPISYATGGAIGAMTQSDFDGDGIIDVALSIGNDLSILLGNADGSFAAGVSYTGVGTASQHLRAADINRDGIVDVVGRTNGLFALFLGNADGSFDQAVSIAADSFPTQFEIADVDRDGVLDLLEHNFTSGFNVHLGVGDGSFVPGVQYGSTTGSNISVGDIDNDGDLDVLRSSSSASVRLLQGNGDGTFQAEVSFSIGSGTGNVALNDLNGDGKLDLVKVDANASSVIVRFGNGDGTFQADQSYDVGTTAAKIRIADVNSDGASDLIVAAATQNTVRVFLGNSLTDNSGTSPPTSSTSAYLALFSGNGDGTFSAGVTFQAGSVTGIASVDIDGDSLTDILFAEGSSDIGVLLSNGDGTFRIGTGYSGSTTLDSVTASDLNNDGAVDAIAYGDTGISIGLNDSGLPGDFYLTLNISGVGDRLTQLRVADLDEDGSDDIVVSSAGDNSVYLLHANGDGTFLAPVSYSAGFEPQDFLLTDTNGDGARDLVVANYDSGKISVLFGNTSSLSFSAPVSFNSNASGTSIASGDLNGDNAEEIVVGNGGTGYASVLRGKNRIVQSGQILEYVSGSSNTDPLRQNLSTKGGAAIALNTLKKLRADIARDVDLVSNVLDEVTAAARFAVEADYAARALSGALTTAGDAEALASRLAETIRARAKDTSIAEHSSLDSTLVQKLLGQ